MAIDFNNRATAGSTDPNAVVSVQPSQNMAWIKTDKDGAWQGNIVINDSSPGPDYRSVGYATVTLNDGRQFRAVLDGSGQPISEVGDQVGIDDKQHSAFVQGSNASTPNSGAQTQRQPDGTINQWDPNGLGPGRGGYTIPRPDLSPAGTIQTPQQKREEAERQKNAALPGPNPNGATEAERRGQDPRPETDAERAARADALIKQQGEQARQATIDAQNAANVAHDNQLADANAAQAAAIRNRPNVTIQDDGKGGLVAVSVDPNTGKATTEPVPGVAGKPPTLTLNGRLYERQSDGSYVDKTPAQTGVAPTSPAPKPNLSYSQLTQGLQAASEFYDDQVRQWQASGGKQGMSPEAATKAMQQRIDLANSAMKEQTGVIGDQQAERNSDVTQRGQTLTDTASRRTAAENLYNNTINTLVPMARYAGKGGGAAGAGAIQEILRGGRDYVNSFGGLDQTPPVNSGGFPAIAQVRQASMAASAPPPAPPSPVQPRPVTAPLLGPPPAVGADPMAPIPGVHMMPPGGGAAPASAAPPPPPAPSIPAATNPVTDQPITLPPTPAGAGSRNADTQPNQPMMPPPAPDAGQGALPPLPSTPAADPVLNITNRTTGERKQLPLSQLNTLPDRGDYDVEDPNGSGAVTPGAPASPPVAAPPNFGQPGMSVLPDPNAAPPPPVGMTQPSFVQNQRAGNTQPVPPLVQQLINDPQVDNSILAEAYRNVYGLPLQLPGQ